MSKPKWVCETCGSEEVHIKMWVHANTLKCEDDIDPGKCWCCNCGAHGRVVTKEDFHLKEKG